MSQLTAQLLVSDMKLTFHTCWYFRVFFHISTYHKTNVYYENDDYSDTDYYGDDENDDDEDDNGDVR